MFDLIIIGGGPAGVAAAVYAGRKKLHTLLMTKEFGGQSSVSEGIENWIGTPNITGTELARAFKVHVESIKNGCVEIHEGAYVQKIAKTGDTFSVETEKGTFETKTILIATGSTRRKLEVPGAAEFENKGVVYCASCDGPLFSDQDVAVVGGGNAAFETAAQLLAYCKSVTLLQRGLTFRADPITVERVLAHENMRAITNTEIVSVQGDKFVNGLTYKDTTSGETKTLPVTGVFVEIGLLPNTGFARDLVTRDEYNRIVIDPWTGRTSAAGIWAAGDATNVKYHQNNIAAGDGVKALEDIYLALKTGK
ncbi:MAG: FAD-dependent oxidoreductase [Patescibacteria group bacterium]